MEIKKFEVKSGKIVNAISSRQIAEITGKRHNHVVRDISEMCANADIEIIGAFDPKLGFYVENQDVVVIESEYEYQAGSLKRKATEMLLNEMAAELLATGYDVKRRLEVLKLIKALREAVEQPTHQIPQTLSQALMLAANQAEQIEKQQAVIEESKPKVEFADAVMASEDSISIKNMATMIGYGRNNFFQLLRKDGILIASGKDKNSPYQKYINSGYFEVTEKPVQLEYAKVINIATMVTPKGQQWLAKKFAPSADMSHLPQLPPAKRTKQKKLVWEEVASKQTIARVKANGPSRSASMLIEKIFLSFGLFTNERGTSLSVSLGKEYVRLGWISKEDYKPIFVGGLRVDYDFNCHRAIISKQVLK